MHCYFLRHGDAEGTSQSGRDEDRELSSKGEKQIKNLAHILAETNTSFDLVLTSPYRRARKTAELVHENLRNTPEPTVLSQLACGARWSPLKDYLFNSLDRFQKILFVGHMPDLGTISAQLLHMDHGIPLKTATLIGLEIDDSLENTFPGQITIFLRGSGA